jgi:hypothetical protein
MDYYGQNQASSMFFPREIALCLLHVAESYSKMQFCHILENSTIFSAVHIRKRSRQAVNIYGRMEVQLRTFLTTPLHGNGTKTNDRATLSVTQKNISEM